MRSFCWIWIHMVIACSCASSTLEVDRTIFDYSRARDLPYVVHSNYSSVVQAAIDRLDESTQLRQRMLRWVYSRMDRGDDVLLLEMSGMGRFYQFIALARSGRGLECYTTLIPRGLPHYEAVNEPILSAAEAASGTLAAFRQAVAGVCGSPPLTTPPPDLHGGGEVIFRVAITGGMVCKTIDYGCFDVEGSHWPYEEGGAPATEVRAFDALLDVWRSMASGDCESPGARPEGGSCDVHRGELDEIRGTESESKDSRE